jgi:photosystem II stability/assembly factor-like uncharacterized protein
MKKLLLPALILAAGTAANAQWTEQATGFTNEARGVSEIHIVDPNTVWCLAYDGTDTSNNIQEFTKTTDGGENWTAGSIDIGHPTWQIVGISPTNGTTCFAGAVDADNGGGGVWRTQDEGLNWINTNDAAYTSPTSFFNAVYMFNEMEGITMGDPIGTGAGHFEIYLTSDGGDTWGVPTGTVPNPLGTVGSSTNAEYGYNGGNVGVGDSFWFVTNRGSLYRTQDKGATWQKFTNVAGLSDFSATGQGGSIYFSDANNGILIKRATVGTTSTYQLYQTSNGGQNYTLVGPYTVPYLSLAYIPGTTTLVGTGGTSAATYASAYSPDNGVTWNTIDTGEQRTAVAFYDGTTGWMGGFNIDDVTGGIWKYTGTALANYQVGPQPLFTVSPNPTNGVVRVSNDSNNISEVVVYDLLGKQVYNQKFSAVGNAEINLSSLTSGAYILKATVEGGASQTVKIVKN